MLNKSKLRSYLTEFNDVEQRHIKFIVDNTLYITTKMLLSRLRTVLTKHILPKRDFVLYDNYEKWGSENWLMTELYDFLGKPPVIKYPDLRKVTKPIHLLIIDDCIYSGGNMCHSLHKIIALIDDSNNLSFKDITIDIVTGFSTLHGFQKVLNCQTDIQVYLSCYERYNSIMELVNMYNYPMDWKFFNDICCPYDDSFYTKYDDKPFNNLGLIWFEHKLAAYNSTVSCILCHITDLTSTVVRDSFARYNELCYMTFPQTKQLTYIGKPKKRKVCSIM